MRAKLLGAVLAALVIPAAMAADVGKAGKIAAPPAAQADEPTVWNRTGAYVGVLGAYDAQIMRAEGFSVADGNLMGGAFVGFNWRASQHFILGIEGDWMLTGIKASSSADEISLTTSTNHIVSLRGRAGMAFGPALLYVTAGPAWQNVRMTVGDLTQREWQLGAAMGAGAEVELTRSFAIRLEAMHYIFPANGAPLAQFFDSENQHTMVRLGVIFKLN